MTDDRAARADPQLRHRRERYVNGIALSALGVFESARTMNAAVGASQSGCWSFWLLAVEPR
jgi:hypothetical protein